MGKCKEALETMRRRCENHEMCQGTGCGPKKELEELINASEKDQMSEDRMGAFCDNYCRMPLECISEEELKEVCDNCPMNG